MKNRQGSLFTVILLSCIVSVLSIVGFLALTSSVWAGETPSQGESYLRSAQGAQVTPTPVGRGTPTVTPTPIPDNTGGIPSPGPLSAFGAGVVVGVALGLGAGYLIWGRRRPDQGPIDRGGSRRR